MNTSMFKRSRVRSTSLAGAMALVLASGCQAKTAPSFPAQPPPEPTPISYEFDAAALSKASDFQPESNAADITDVPIHVWVGKGASGQVEVIRITGHASSAVCAKASLAVLDFLADTKNVAGFLGFGVADLRAAAGAPDFPGKAGALLRELRALSAKNPEYVVISEYTVVPDLTTAPPEAGEGARLVVSRYRDPKLGPAFIPVRTWTPGKEAAPVRIDVTTSTLGLDGSTMAKLAPEMSIAPLVEFIELQRSRVKHLGRITAWRRSGKSFNDGVNSFRIQTFYGSPPAARLAEATTTLQRYAVKAYAVSLFIESITDQKVSVRERIRLDGLANKIDAATKVNQQCADLVAKNQRCSVFHDIEPSFSSGGGQEAMVAILSAFDKMSTDELIELENEAKDELVELEKNLEWRRKQPAAQRLASARETAIDGLLRGWPIPTSDEDLADRIDAIEHSHVPRAWSSLLDDLRATQGVDLGSERHVAGVLGRSNVFYHVAEGANGKYSVEPMYVVVGPYLEVWDADKHTVTIETASDNIQAMAE